MILTASSISACPSDLSLRVGGLSILEEEREAVSETEEEGSSNSFETGRRLD